MNKMLLLKLEQKNEWINRRIKYNQIKKSFKIVFVSNDLK